jgi:hypothetical protein
MNIAVVGGVRVAKLEVCRGRRAGSVEHADRTRWTFEQPPGVAEWWVSNADGSPLATLRRVGLLGERFLGRLGDADFQVVPRSSVWRRRWSIVDDQRRELLEIVQRPLSRPVHDLYGRSGDIPADLPLLAAWLVGLATSAPMPETRRPRWTVH